MILVRFMAQVANKFVIKVSKETILLINLDNTMSNYTIAFYILINNMLIR